MNYSKIYENLVERARSRTLDCYTERHHVIPRCLGGSDDPGNLVDLTGPEHALAHLLLVKMYPGNLKLIFAANIMLVNANGIRYPMSRNKQYGWLKEKAAKAMGDLRRGSKHTEDAKRKISEGNKGKVISEEHKRILSDLLIGKPGMRLGAVLTDETKSKMSEAASARSNNAENGRVLVEAQAAKSHEERSESSTKAWETRRINGTDKFSDEQRAKMSASQKNRNETPEEASARAKKARATRVKRGTDKVSDETREKQRLAQTGKKQSPETVAKRKATIAANKAAKALKAA